MVKYYCDMCKLEKKKSEIRILQTKQPDGSIQTNHLCDTCCGTITELCKTYLSAPGQVGKLPEDKLKAEEKVEGVKRPKVGRKRKEETTELEEFEVSKEVTHAVQAVGVAVDENAKGIAGVAETATELSNDVGEITDIATSNKNVVESINKGMDKFIVE